MASGVLGVHYIDVGTGLCIIRLLVAVGGSTLDWASCMVILGLPGVPHYVGQAIFVLPRCAGTPLLMV